MKCNTHNVLHSISTQQKIIGNYYVNYQNFQNSMLLSSLDNKRPLMIASILVYKFRPERTGFNTYTEYTFLAL